MKIRKLSIKLHFFCFWAAIGCIFPFLPVYAKQLGVSPLIMGSIYTVLPILYMIAKPTFGLILDYFHTQKKLLFITILVISSGSYILLYFLPSLPKPILSEHQFQNISYVPLPSCDVNYNSSATNNDMKNTTCHWICKNTNFSAQVFFHTIKEKEIFSPNTTCLLNIDDASLYQEGTMESYGNCNVTCNILEDNFNLYTSITFWGFVILMSLCSVGFHVFMSLSTAIALEILGKNAEMDYSKLYMHGEIGYGLAALLTGYAVDTWSEGKVYKIYTPAFLFAFIFSCIDLICCRKFKLPRISTSLNIFADVYTILKFKFVIIFLCFTMIIGVFDGYMINFLLWYEEDLAMKTGNMDKIKLIQGLTVAAEAFGCGIIILFFFDKILQKLGHGYAFTLSLVSYAIRMGLISVAPTPWWIILIEFFTLGPAYTLSYMTIIMFVNSISSSGISSSIQGIVAGIKEGFGVAIGNFVGSVMLKNFGGALALQVFSISAAFSAAMYFLLYITYLKYKIPGVRNTEWRTPDDAQRHCDVAE